MRQKVSCNTTVSRTLLKEAKALDIKLSEVFEAALNSAVRDKRKDLWFRDNAEAIREHNTKISEVGTFSESIGQIK